MFEPKFPSDRRPFEIERRLTSRTRTLHSIAAPQLVGASSQFHAVLQQIEKIGGSDAGVLIQLYEPDDRSKLRVERGGQFEDPS